MKNKLLICLGKGFDTDKNNLIRLTLESKINAYATQYYF